ncbi:F-box/LRR-repeat protein At4g14103-like [Vigna unguiculata]|uniref:F-box domain-containing protein n=1 Tax=Vigna unguiculata TaxID=3917 RepID=A0A4D6NH50_VIGUN|nr:F-box/LRR-repeat protein At4g14103-like [Vigna unguiculata]QCE11515.1 hypothetical protein DEO72_LG10g2748 [Vigna unguiculata]
MAEPSAKILRQTLDGEADNIDRLSALPESVLLSILSRLELKEAAATSVLSTTWRDLFLQLPNIWLNFHIYGNPSDHPRLFHIFTLFANRVLRERNPEAPIRFLKVCVRNFTQRMEEDYTSLLMSAAVAVSTYKVYQFDLRLTCSLLIASLEIAIPPAMFASDTLTSLRLTISAGWDVPENVWLPNVINVHFIPYTLMHENSTQRFLDGCPRLQDLMLMIGIISNYEIKVKTLRMSSSSLKSLRLGWDQMDETETMSIIVKSESLLRLTLSLTGGHKVNVDAPNLSFFSITGEVRELNMTQNSPSIDEAVVDVEYTIQSAIHSQNASTFMRALENARVLDISEGIMKALYDSTSAMPIFRNLYMLRLIPDYYDDVSRSRIQQVLFNLLEHCPNLREIFFEKVMVFDDIHNYIPVNFESAFPPSMVQNLKNLEIFDFRCRNIEYKLVEFFMKNGQSLEIVSLRKDNVRGSWTPNEEGRILSVMTCSEECDILFRHKSESKIIYRRNLDSP